MTSASVPPWLLMMLSRQINVPNTSSGSPSGVIGSGMLVLSLRILVFSFCMLWPIWVEVALSKKVLYCICCWLWERSTSSSSCIHIVHWIKFLLWAVVSLWIMTNFIHGSYCYMQQQQFKPNPSKIETILKMEPPLDKAGVKRLRGTTNYLSKVSP